MESTDSRENEHAQESTDSRKNTDSQESTDSRESVWELEEWEENDSVWDDYREQGVRKAVDFTGQEVELGSGESLTTENKETSTQMESTNVLPQPSRPPRSSSHPPRKRDKHAARSQRTIRRVKKRAERIRSLEGAFIKDGWKDPCDSPIVQELATNRLIDRPRWATRALVMLRDGGQCQICHAIDAKGETVQVVPPKLHGEYIATNCIYLCSNCFVCWPRYMEQKFTGHGTAQEDFDAIRLYVMMRRMKGYKGCKVLSSDARAEFHRLYRESEIAKHKKEVERQLSENPELRRHVMEYMDSVLGEYRGNKRNLSFMEEFYGELDEWQQRGDPIDSSEPDNA